MGKCTVAGWRGLLGKRSVGVCLFCRLGRQLGLAGVMLGCRGAEAERSTYLPTMADVIATQLLVVVL